MDDTYLNEKSQYEKILDVLVYFSLLLITLFFVMDLFLTTEIVILETLRNYYFYFSIFFFIIFFIDLVNLYKNHSENGKDFVKHYWLDIIATIPIGLILTLATVPSTEIFKIIKLGRIGKFSKYARASQLIKEFKAAGHLKKESQKFEKNL